MQNGAQIHLTAAYIKNNMVHVGNYHILCLILNIIWGLITPRTISQV